MYSAASIINAFAGAGILFLIMALYGYFTKTDLTKLGTILLVGLIAIIVLSLINVLFIHSSGFDLVLSIVGLLIFLGLVAFELQTLKMAALTGDERLEIVFGISLYLDFINIFLELLKFFGLSDE
jgi:FtsH-binding integral membrane protein